MPVTENKVVILDFNRTLYDPDSGSLVTDACLVLRELSSRGHVLCLLSRREGGRDELVDSLGIRDYFSKVYFVDRKSVASFETVLDEHNACAAASFVVGDYVPDEIAFGNAVGMTTIWARWGKFSDVPPTLPHQRPDYVVGNLRGVLEIIS